MERAKNARERAHDQNYFAHNRDEPTQNFCEGATTAQSIASRKEQKFLTRLIIIACIAIWFQA